MNTPTPEPVRVDLMLELILSMAVVHGWPREAIERRVPASVHERPRQQDDAEVRSTEARRLPGARSAA